VQSTKRSDYGAFKLSAGKFYGDAEKDKGESTVYHNLLTLWEFSTYIGIQTSQDAHFYARTAKFDEVFNNEGKSLVIQFSVKHEQKIDCGGGYVKASTVVCTQVIVVCNSVCCNLVVSSCVFFHVGLS